MTQQYRWGNGAFGWIDDLGREEEDYMGFRTNANDSGPVEVPMKIELLGPSWGRSAIRRGEVVEVSCLDEAEGLYKADIAQPLM